MKSRLLEPFKIGQLELKNRIVMAPVLAQYGSKDGYVTERTKMFYRARAQGGTALIIVEASYVHPQGQAHKHQLGISDDKFIPGMSELAQTIHQYGAKVAIQLHHGGRRANSELSGMRPIACSELVTPKGDVTEELTADGITENVAYFVQAAVRAKKAKADGVEIHAAHGYLIDNFISRSSNKRQDLYGGSLHNRARFLVEIIKEVRKAVGEDYPVWCRINGREFGEEKGTTLEEAKEIARMAQEAGADAIHVSAFGPESPLNSPTPKFTAAILADLAEEIKGVVTIPVIIVGMVTTEAGKMILTEGKADAIAVARGFLADPEIPNKVAAGRLEDIVPCILCQRCRDDTFDPTVFGIRCSVNAALGKEAEYSIITAEKKKKVLVVGGGPAGMEAARVAALRGHTVILWEQEPRLGGQLNQAAIPPYKDRIGALTKYLQIQLNKLGVDIKLGKMATADMIEEVGPDVVVLATGVKPFIPEMLGIDEARVVLARDVLEGGIKIGNKVAIIGGELVGCETAEFLAEKGRKVTVMRRGPEMALRMSPTLRPFLLNRLTEKGVALLTEVKYDEVTTRALVVMTKEGERKNIAADTIVLAAGSIPNKELYEEVKGKLPEVYLVGDCVRPGTIREAIADGYHVGLKI